MVGCGRGSTFIKRHVCRDDAGIRDFRHVDAFRRVVERDHPERMSKESPISFVNIGMREDPNVGVVKCFWKIPKSCSNAADVIDAPQNIQLANCPSKHAFRANCQCTLYFIAQPGRPSAKLGTCANFLGDIVSDICRNSGI